jgi:uncharacterized protein (TIGR00299 family) protein
MTLAYLDAFSGISGDMTLGALVHLGVPIQTLQETAAALRLGNVDVTAAPQERNGIRCIKVSVVDREQDRRRGHRTFTDICALLDGASLPAAVRDRARAVFRALAEAEGRVHGSAPEAVHFHEVGAIDSLVDIVGAAAGFHHLGIDTLYASALPLGRGSVRTEHGVLPVPGPATVELLRGWPVRLPDGDAELVTPTGAALVAALASPGPPPELRITGAGYGCGDRILADRPNVLRIVTGQPVVTPRGDEVVCIEANVDDLNPELFEHVMARLLAAGARDVSLTPIHMKKNRPGTLLRVLGDPADLDALAAIVFQETTTLGVRHHVLRRLVVARETVEVETRYGRVAVRVARAPDGTPNVAPEYESCRSAAQAHRVPLKVVYQAAIVAFASR